MINFSICGLKPKVFVSVFEVNVSLLSSKDLYFQYNKRLDKWKLCLNHDGLFISTIWLPYDVVWIYYCKCYDLCLDDLPFRL